MMVDRSPPGILFETNHAAQNPDNLTLSGSYGNHN